MVKLSVFLVRSGETIADVPGPIRVSHTIDPPLTAHGYQHAQNTWTALMAGLVATTPLPSSNRDNSDSDNSDGVTDPCRRRRQLACFAAPLQACQGTAAMVCGANLAVHQDVLTFRYTTVEAATSPTAVPILTVNDLCRQVPAIQACGGVRTVVSAGLLHTAAADWNETGRGGVKCPMQRIMVQEYKETAGPLLLDWTADRTVDPPRRVLEVQSLRLDHSRTGDETAETATETTKDPWCLQPMSPKVNLTIDMLEVRKYRTPPRQGTLDRKLPGAAAAKWADLEVTPVPCIQDCVWKARQVGCDTVLLSVPAAAIQCLRQDVGGSSSSSSMSDETIGPCTVLSLTADFRGPNDVEWTVVSLCPGEDTAELEARPEAMLPAFEGPVDCLVPPPEGHDPASVPANQWSRFPPPEPENIPPDYPDLPPFGSALKAPVPKAPPVTGAATPAAGRGSAGRGGRGRGGGRGGRGRQPLGRGGRQGGRVPLASGGGGRVPTTRA